MINSGEKFYIESINFPSNQTFQPQKLNVIVGANNVGKSRLLRTIRDTILGDEATQNLNKDVALNLHFPETSEYFIQSFDVEKHLKSTGFGFTITDYCNVGLSITPYGYETTRKTTYSISYEWDSEIYNWYMQEIGPNCVEPFRDKNFEIRRRYGSLFVNYCGTEDRLLLAAGEKYYDIKDSESNTLSWAIGQEDKVRKLNSALNKIFHKNVKLDLFANSGNVTVKVLDGATDFDEITTTSVQESQTLNSLYYEGDGIKSFFAVAMSLLANQKPVILIDEPESHLYPSQAYELGRLIAQQAYESEDIQVFVVTHSTHLLKGITDTKAKDDALRIVNITRNEGISQYNVIEQEVFAGVNSHALLKNGRFYEGLFSKNVIVVESESDSLVYNALLEKMDYENEFLIINAHSKDEFHYIADFYKKLGVQFHIIADFDIINDANKLAIFGRSISIEEPEINRICTLTRSIQKAIRDKFGNKSKEVYKNVAETVLENIKDDVESIRSVFIEHGCLIVPTGELETVLEDFCPYIKDKSEWLPKALDIISNLTIEQLSELRIFRSLQQIIGK